MFRRRLHTSKEHPDASRVRDPAYWQNLQGAPPLDPLPGAVSLPSAGAHPGESLPLAALTADGYLAVPAVLDTTGTHAMLATVHAVRSHGWPGVFAFLYSTFWQALWSPDVLDLLHQLSGQRPFVLAPQGWVFHVPGLGGARGWPPHVDYEQADASDAAPQQFTLWLALTPASVDSGCIYLVPPACLPPAARAFARCKTLSMDDVVELLHNVRAVPVAAGGAVCWRFDTVHWGGPVLGHSGTPRISVGLEVHVLAPGWIAAPGTVLPGTVPSWEHRLMWVARSLEAFAVPQREPHAAAFCKILPA